MDVGIGFWKLGTEFEVKHKILEVILTIFEVTYKILCARDAHLDVGDRILDVRNWK